jgi:hypothetical protein
MRGIFTIFLNSRAWRVVQSHVKRKKANETKADSAVTRSQSERGRGAVEKGITFGVRRYASSGPRRLFCPRELPFVPSAESDPPRNLGRMLFAAA